jgi:antitoxin YefM
MDIINYTEARQNLKGVMDRVVAAMTEIVVARQNGEAVVMVSLAQWNSINETLHLFSSPNNAARLLTAIRELEDGAGTEHELIETEHVEA